MEKRKIKHTTRLAKLMYIDSNTPPATHPFLLGEKRSQQQFLLTEKFSSYSNIDRMDRGSMPDVGLSVFPHC